VLVLVLGALLLAYAYPVRLYLNQQAQISSAEAAQAAQRRHIAQLTEEAAKWNDDEYKKAQIKKRLQMVPPGSVAYTLVGPASAAPAGDPDTGRAKDTGPWYGQLWSSVQAADKPRVAP
jgi:cell division protein FtsB